MNRFFLALLLSTPLALSACGGGGGTGDHDGGGDPNAPDADPNAPDADPNAPDADPNAPDAGPTNCVPDLVTDSECSNCVDDDSDGFIDSSDPECTSLEDNDEASFATGIPGDNADLYVQDCFFDGDSGAGNDGCNFHTCCLLGAADDAECDALLGGGGPPFNPATSCEVTQQCTDSCGAITPPGCDCFGCCTICNGADCIDVLTNPAVYANPDCTGITNPTEGECCEAENNAGCYTCTKSADCGGDACDDDPTDCILCPGQTEADLPPECTAAECPTGVTPCDLAEQCGADQFCSNGCCLDAVIID